MYKKDGILLGLAKK